MSASLQQTRAPLGMGRRQTVKVNAFFSKKSSTTAVVDKPAAK
jgi:hypothetical protein